jgi:hypothetical protein
VVTATPTQTANRWILFERIASPKSTAVPKSVAVDFATEAPVAPGPRASRILAALRRSVQTLTKLRAGLTIPTLQELALQR